MPKTVRIEPSSEAPAALVAEAKDMLGRVLAGRYRVDSLLAARPWGGVYRAEHLELAVWTALKVVRSTAEAGEITRIERQAMAGAQIRHPNVALVTDAGQLPDGSRYLAMELVLGSTLREVLRAGPVPSSRAVAIARQLLAALHALHEAGIVHANLEPESVIVSGPSGEFAKVVDLGRARLDPERIAVFDRGVVTDAARRAALVKPVAATSSAYQAPEAVVGGAEIDARADLFSTGAILYEMLSGQPPFDADDGARPFAALRGAAPPLSERAPEVVVGAALSAFVDRLLSQDRNARYPSAAAALAALGEADAPTERGAAAASAPATPRGAAARSAPPPAEPKRSSPPAGGPVLLGRVGAGTAGSAVDRAVEAAREGGSMLRRLAARLPPALDRSGLPRWAIAATALGAIALLSAVWMVATKPSETTGDEAPVAAAGSHGATRGQPVEVAPGAEAAAVDSARAVTLEVGGRDGAAWRKQLHAAVDSQDWARAGKATEALIELGETEFRDAKVVGAVMSTAVALEAVGGRPADAVFEGLRSRLGTRGIEILLGIARNKGGTKGSKRAIAILDEPDVVARQPPPLRIAIELFRTPCDRKAALFQRAAEEGDERALTALRVLREAECPRRRQNPCCFRDDKELARAIERLRERLGKPVEPARDD